MSQKRFTTLFLTFHFFACLFFQDFMIMQNPNPLSRLLPVISLTDERVLNIDKSHQLVGDKCKIEGHYYSDKAPLVTFLVAPFYKLTDSLIYSPDTLEKKIALAQFWGNTLCGALPFTIFIYLLFLLCRDTDIPYPVLSSACLAYGSFVFLYASTSFGHLLAGILVVSSYCFFKKEKYILSGLLLGFGFLTEYPTALFAIFMAIEYIVHKKNIKPFLRFTIGMVPLVFCGLLYNKILTGSFLEFPYKYVTNESYGAMQVNMGFGQLSAEAIWGLTFSGARGLFYYVPFLLPMLLLAGVSFYKKQIFALSSFVIFLLFFASYYMWWGGFCYGPRHLMPTAMVMIYCLVPYMKNINLIWRHAITALALMGCAMVLIAKMTFINKIPYFIKHHKLTPIYGDTIDNPIWTFAWPEIIEPKILKGQSLDWNLLSWCFGVPPWTAFAVWLFFFIGGMYVLFRSWPLQKSI